MASTKEYRDYILEQLSGLSDISYRPMMGEDVDNKDRLAEIVETMANSL